MLHFECDYCNGAHPALLQALLDTNGQDCIGYGEDPFSEQARAKIRTACHTPDAHITFLGGGTQTNLVVISSMLDTTEGVVCCDTGHINGHEAGAIECTGHKVMTVPHTDGKLTACALDQYLTANEAEDAREHLMIPGMVYISHPTEYGTLYSLSELTELSGVCRRHGLPLYLDGARLAYGLAACGTDLTLPDIARLCDVFYIGGTKCGALCGEAVVFPGGNPPKRFFSHVKQHGAVFAKGRLCSLQFDALFTDDLYGKIGAHAIAAAQRLKALFVRRGYTFFIDSPTNQIFLLLDNETADRLAKSVCYTIWEKPDEGHTVCRFVTSWSTTEEDLSALEALL